MATLAQSVTELFDVVRLINKRHKTNWSLVGRLPGGYLQGAYENVAPTENAAFSSGIHMI